MFLVTGCIKQFLSSSDFKLSRICKIRYNKKSIIYDIFSNDDHKVISNLHLSIYVMLVNNFFRKKLAIRNEPSNETYNLF